METINGRVICYTDGACKNNGRHDASAGFGVVFGLDHPWYVLFILHSHSEDYFYTITVNQLAQM